jgi:hypothetical protein
MYIRTRRNSPNSSIMIVKYSLFTEQETRIRKLSRAVHLGKRLREKGRHRRRKPNNLQRKRKTGEERKLAAVNRLDYFQIIKKGKYQTNNF